jgi:endonuclease/exonuclease/phosphatase family metal-dependent hydrolase
MTYNVHSCVGEDGVYDVERVASVVRSTGASIVCLQEIECNTEKGGR